MIGIEDHEYAALRLEAFAQEVLAPAVYPVRCPLDLAVFQTADRIDVSEAARAEFAAVAPGFRWGPAWSTAWFRIRGRVPASMAGQRVCLRFSSGTEALLWLGGRPRRGFDDNRETAVLFDPAAGGEDLDLLVEAACNLPLGVSTFWWDHAEVQRRWQEERPGRVERCELVAVDSELWQFLQMFEFLRRLALTLPGDSALAAELIRGLREVVRRVPPADPRRALEQSALLEELLAGRGGAPATTCIAIGHAHIDTAWLWPLAETRRKILRSWGNALDLMGDFPRLHFICSQAQQYAFLEEDSPELFAAVSGRVEEGRWEPAGAMWVEADCHAPSGESLVRQILHGTRWFEAHFGARAPQRFLYLPDTFGFPASLPQIARRAGLETFITNKMSWCERNEFPHTTFRWRGIDGTEIVSHFTPGDNYNSPLEPRDLRHGEDQLVRKGWREVGRSAQHSELWLQPFGFGDGGGGPTAEQACRADLAAAAAGLPRVEQCRADEFCERLHAERHRRLEETGRDLPVWDGELYLELHRGTYTSQAWLKRANAEAERRLRRLEALLVLLGEDAARRRAALLDESWKTVLLHQFHDILPGTSIGEVYRDARHAYEKLEERLDAALEETLGAVGDGLGSRGEEASAVVFNPASHSRAGSVECGGRRIWVEDVPPLGVVRVDVARIARPRQPVSLSGLTLQSGKLTATLDAAGRVAELRAEGADGPVNAVPGGASLAPLHQLVAYEDRPRRWEAWDIDYDYTDRADWLEGPADSIEPLETGPLRAVVEVARTFRESRIVQRYTLEADSPFLAVEMEVDWRESQTLLRSLNPTRIRARSATYGIQFGCLERPAHANTSFEEARYEVPGQRWMDLSQPGLGLAVLDDCKYGRSCRDGVLGLSLLRSPGFPDAQSDRGLHRFTLGLMPHGGDWRQAGVPRQADVLGDPLVALELPGAQPREGEGAAQLLELERAGAGDLEIACLKPAEDGDGAVLRLVERHGGESRVTLHWKVPVASVTAADLRERPDPDLEVEHDPVRRRTRLALAPFQIATLRLRFGSGEAR